MIKPAETKLKFIKVADLPTKRRHRHGCFPGNFDIFFESYAMERQSIFLFCIKSFDLPYEPNSVVIIN